MSVTHVRVVTATVLGLVAAMLAVTAPSATATGREASRPAAETTRVLVVTLDGVGSRVLRRLGPRRTPVLHRLLRQGAGTLEARTTREQTSTLPGHTSIVTGRRITGRRGHQVTWNDDRQQPATVQEAAGHRVASMFSVARGAGRPALYTAQPTFSLFDRSWPAGVARFELGEDDTSLARLVRRDLRRGDRPLSFLHLSAPDRAGHGSGFSSSAYRRAVVRTDRRLGTIVRTVVGLPRLRRHLAMVVTTDHGGKGAGHTKPAEPANYRIPFVVWGAGVADGADLYDLNPDYRDPGSRRTRYATKRQPVRNADAANVATRLLGLGAVPGSEFGSRRRLDVR